MNNKIVSQWKKDECAPFEGWNFSHLKRRVTEEKPPWNYVKTAKKLAKGCLCVLDIDTGGGEVLSKIISRRHKCYAIEGYTTNVRVARKNLKRLGVNVIYANSSRTFPFNDETFDCVLNRHGAINAKEIYRVLKKDGVFFTQQVDTRKNLIDLLRIFGAQPKWVFNYLQYRKKELVQLGFTPLKAHEWKGNIIFKDVGALVYFLKATSWLVDNFSVRSHHKYLERLQKKLEKEGKLQFTIARFCILAQKK